MGNGTLGTILQQGGQSLISGFQTGLNIAETIKQRKERQLQRQKENAGTNQKILAFTAEQEIKRKKEEDRTTQLRIDRLQNIANLPGTPTEIQADLFKEVGQLSGVDLGNVSTRLSPEKKEQFFTGVAALMKSFTDPKTGQVDMAGFRPNLNKLTSKWRQLGLNISSQDKSVSQFIKEGVTQSEKSAKLQRDIQQEQPIKQGQELPLITETTIVNDKEVTTAKRGDQVISEVTKPIRTKETKIETLTQKANEAQDIIEKGVETKGEFGGIDPLAIQRKRSALTLIEPLLKGNPNLSGFRAGVISLNLLSSTLADDIPIPEQETEQDRIIRTFKSKEKALISEALNLILEGNKLEDIALVLKEQGINTSKLGF